MMSIVCQGWIDRDLMVMIDRDLMVMIDRDLMVMIDRDLMVMIGSALYLRNAFSCGSRVHKRAVLGSCSIRLGDDES